MSLMAGSHRLLGFLCADCDDDLYRNATERQTVFHKALASLEAQANLGVGRERCLEDDWI